MSLGNNQPHFEKGREVKINYPSYWLDKKTVICDGEGICPVTGLPVWYFNHDTKDGLGPIRYGLLFEQGEPLNKRQKTKARPAGKKKRHYYPVKSFKKEVEDPSKRGLRTCLKCRKKFMSTHMGNRLCKGCNAQALNMRSGIDQ